jgi:pantoate--beta-alanine ligase
MQRISDPSHLRAWRATHAMAGRRVALVPTMGALHEGHLSLIAQARAEAEVVIASIYVNPTQFDRADDLAAYPRDPEGDAALLARAGCDALFEPKTLYATDHATWVEVPALSESLCGAARPGHFRGVATVVTKLLNLVGPDVAVFGEKDFQQVRVIRRLVRDLDMPVRVVSAPTVREPDGLAMSSRNRRLTPAQRVAAPAIYEALRTAATSGQSSGSAPGSSGASVGARLAALRQSLEAAGGVIDYVAAVDPDSLAGLPEDAPPPPGACFAVAVFFGPVRLIDNVTVA